MPSKPCPTGLLRKLPSSKQWRRIVGQQPPQRRLQVHPGQWLHQSGQGRFLWIGGGVWISQESQLRTLKLETRSMAPIVFQTFIECRINMNKPETEGFFFPNIGWISVSASPKNKGRSMCKAFSGSIPSSDLHIFWWVMVGESRNKWCGDGTRGAVRVQCWNLYWSGFRSGFSNTPKRNSIFENLENTKPQEWTCLILFQ